MQISKDEIKRVDKVHARADQACEQIRQGHLITECMVLGEDENNCERVVWNAEELALWAKRRLSMLRLLNRYSTDAGVLGSVIRDDVDAYIFQSPKMARDPYATMQTRGLVLYRQSAIYLAAFPPPDAYTKSDKAGS